MSRTMTPILLAVALAMGVVTYLAERSSPSDGSAGRKRAPRVLNVEQADILQVRVKRDFWNSFVLQRAPDSSWELIEPSKEPAAESAVTRLLGAVEDLPLVTTIDLPADDSERHREYGLWEPGMELTVTTSAGEHTLAFGAKTPDQKGVYCAETGRDGVYVTTARAVEALSADYAAYRHDSGAPASQPHARGGLHAQDLHVGSGTAAHAGASVTVHYTGRLTDGKVFDSSVTRGKPFTFKLGAHQVIPGWDRGVQGMRVGGKRRLTIPPELAYGAKGHPPVIPPNATLIFEIELLSVAK